MSAVLFDTLRLSRTLRDKGNFTPEQAEALAEALGDATQDNLATKADLSVLKSDIAAMTTKLDTCATRFDLREAELRLEAKIETTKADLLKWIVGAIGLQTMVIIGAVIALTRVVK